MPGRDQHEKATLKKVEFVKGGRTADADAKVDSIEVQFNPETMRIDHRNAKVERQGAYGNAALQYIGYSSSTLQFDLWFDATRLSDESRLEATDDEPNVRAWTKKVLQFLRPERPDAEDMPWKVPGIRFDWGDFSFDGVIDSVNESLEFFSESGNPLRAKLTVRISRVQEPPPEKRGNGATPGTERRRSARQGQSVQDMAAESGRPGAWRDVAAANDVENPRNLQPGQQLDMSPQRRSGRGGRRGGFGNGGSLTGGRSGTASGPAGRRR